MRHKRLGVAWMVGAALVAGLTLSGKARGNGRDFSGSYQVSDVSVSGDTASLTLRLRLFNHSTADVSNATVVLRDWVVPSRSYGSFPNVNIPTGKTVELSGTFQVPQHEYQSWQRGRPPFLMLEYTDGAGSKVRRPIEVLGHVRPEAGTGSPPEAMPSSR
ncbi:MAG TPA: hypothetical protein VJO16_19200 [Candidatus Acidoferrum sp.]|nr:hypothetical protein [Candidatus Acidoferrum sp.]